MNQQCPLYNDFQLLFQADNLDNQQAGYYQ